MNRRLIHVAMAMGFILLAGCATVKDVQRSSDLIRTDNELARLLQDVRPEKEVSYAADVTNLAIHAKGEADALVKNSRGKERDAIAYYRIAATAYWKNGDSGDANQLFEVADRGRALCVQLEDRAPDRDCLYLQLVIPLAAFEEEAWRTNLNGLLNEVNLYDDGLSPEEIQTMKKIHTSLARAKRLLDGIFDIGDKGRFETHAGMKAYYCGNAGRAKDYYSPVAGVFETKLIEIYHEFPGATTDLDITRESAAELRKLPELTPVCTEGN